MRSSNLYAKLVQIRGTVCSFNCHKFSELKLNSHSNFDCRILTSAGYKHVLKWTVPAKQRMCFNATCTSSGSSQVYFSGTFVHNTVKMNNFEYWRSSNVYTNLIKFSLSVRPAKWASWLIMDVSGIQFALLDSTRVYCSHLFLLTLQFPCCCGTGSFSFVLIEWQQNTKSRQKRVAASPIKNTWSVTDDKLMMTIFNTRSKYYGVWILG